MDQNQINKLTELKKLYESGVLTKEEMEVEKAKILNASPSQPSAPQHGKSNNKKWIWIGGIAAIVLVICVGVAIISSLHKSDYPEYEEAAVDTIEVYNDDSDVYETTESETTETSVNGEWEGNYKIEGGIYKTTTTSAIFNLRYLGRDTYKGEIRIIAGDPDDDWNFGELRGDVSGTVKGDELYLKISKPYTIKNHNDETLFNSGDYKYVNDGDVIFKLSANGTSYHAEAVSAMKDYFDNTAEPTTITKY